jgi:mannose-6-phosphate isomerase-like protein (cupin superfamily)
VCAHGGTLNSGTLEKGLRAIRSPHRRTERGRSDSRTRSYVPESAVTGYRSSSIDELPTLWDGFAKLVRPGLAIEAFGANIMDLPPDYETKSHDEAESGQQELYVALRGSGAVVVGDDRLALDADHLVCVDPGTPRVLTSGSDGLRVLIVGGVPRGVYEPPEWSSGEESPS